MTITPLPHSAASAPPPLGPLAPSPLDVLFISERALWPATQGFQVHGPQMARALAARGVNVAMTSLEPTPGDAPPWLRALLIDWPTAQAHDVRAFAQSWGGRGEWLRRRLAQRQGVASARVAGLRALVRERRPAAVVALGVHGPMLLAGLRAVEGDEHSPRTVWYAADEPASLELSCLRRSAPTTWPRRLRRAAVHVAMQRAFGSDVDAAIAVSPNDARRLRRVGGAKRVATIRNGVDLDQFSPCDDAVVTRRSLVFWGRMDFEPNVDAVCWFAKRVWPDLRLRWPDARWWIVGKGASARVMALAALPGVTVTGAVADVRDFARQAAAVVLPIRCGAGIKNKLLEAAAMGLPIVASRAAVRGLAWDETVRPAMVCDTPRQWVDAVRRVWSDQQLSAALRTNSRQWAVRHHAWAGAAARMAALLEELGCTVGASGVADDRARRAA